MYYDNCHRDDVGHTIIFVRRRSEVIQCRENLIEAHTFSQTGLSVCRSPQYSRIRNEIAQFVDLASCCYMHYTSKCTTNNAQSILSWHPRECYVLSGV